MGQPCDKYNKDNIVCGLKFLLSSHINKDTELLIFSVFYRVGLVSADLPRSLLE